MSVKMCFVCEKNKWCTRQAQRYRCGTVRFKAYLVKCTYICVMSNTSHIFAERSMLHFTWRIILLNIRYVTVVYHNFLTLLMSNFVNVPMEYFWEYIYIYIWAYISDNLFESYCFLVSMLDASGYALEDAETDVLLQTGLNIIAIELTDEEREKLFSWAWSWWNRYSFSFM